MAATGRMQRGRRLAAVLSSSSVLLCLWASPIRVSALNIGIQRAGTDVSPVRGIPTLLGWLIAAGSASRSSAPVALISFPCFPPSVLFPLLRGLDNFAVFDGGARFNYAFSMCAGTRASAAASAADGDGAVPPLLRYGKYCGLLYTGCPGERPCDGLDACCQIHDACIQAKHSDYLSQECSKNLLNCLQQFRDSGRPTFRGNKCSVDEVVDLITVVMEAALVAGRVLHKP